MSFRTINNVPQSAASVGYLGPARSEKELTIPVEFTLVRTSG